MFYICDLCVSLRSLRDISNPLLYMYWGDTLNSPDNRSFGRMAYTQSWGRITFTSIKKTEATLCGFLTSLK